MISPTARTTELARKLDLPYQIVETNVTWEKADQVEQEKERLRESFRSYAEGVAAERERLLKMAPPGHPIPPPLTLSAAWEAGWMARSEAKTTTMVRKDLFNLADILVLTDKLTVAIQATSGTNVPARRKKISGEARANAIFWLTEPHRKLQIWGWRETKDSKTKWHPRIVEVVLVGGELEFMEFPNSGTPLRDARLAWGVLS